MQVLLYRGSKGALVATLKKRLTTELGAEAALFRGLRASGKANDIFDSNVEAAVRRWQTGVGLIADGIVGPRCMEVLGLEQNTRALTFPLTLATVGPLFPATKPANVSRYLPYVAAALKAFDLVDVGSLLTALGTIRAETEGFLPISEFPSQFNTLPGKSAFSSYDAGTTIGKRLGNTVPGDGARFKGRGFVQLCGRDNYARHGAAVGVDLVTQPDLANQPEVAAVLLASFLHSKRKQMQAALARNDLKKVRQLVNGGSHGLERFKSVFALASHWHSQSTTGAARRVAARKAAPKLERAPRTTLRDTIDLRDRPYIPPPVSLCAEYPGADEIARFLPRYTAAGLILNQGQEGACTGFGLACVINHMHWRQQAMPARMVSVSPRMLYTMARRYDEYDGENYEGSSCRGALKGWFKHGVCIEDDWPYSTKSRTGGTSVQPRFGYAERAVENTLGVYYRIDIKSVTDMQAAIQQVGAIYVSAFTHDGWDSVPASSKKLGGHNQLPLIAFNGEKSMSGGHAFALVGFNRRGFVIQNSWGKEWGMGGFAVLSYDDWLTNAMDAWVAALGVPGVVAGRNLHALQTSTAQRVQGGKRWWTEAEAYQHSVVFGNDGRVQRYLTEDERTRTLAHQVAVLPDLWFRKQAAQTPKRLAIYAHGGLNKEGDAIKRACAMGRYFTDNECYPLFVVWKTGLLESLGNILGEWWHGSQRANLAGGFSDLTDRAIEATIGRGAAKPLWSEMKENSERGFSGGRGGELLVKALQQLLASCDGNLEIHLVGHSAGSIYLGYLLSSMAADATLLGKVRGIHLLAPACTVAFANQHYASRPDLLKRTHISLLSDHNELNDNTAFIYRKSLLYLVSNALEADRRTPLLGMQKVFMTNVSGDHWDGTSTTTAALSQWQRAWASAGSAKLRVLDDPKVTTATTGPIQIAAAHGNFDNDVEVISRTLKQITGRDKLLVPVDDLRGF